MEEIMRNYRKLNIPIECYPHYKTPDELAKSFRKFSAVKNISVHYSSSSTLRQKKNSTK